ncbi:hypothetical protein TELCIR_09130 [Teladorsagia circumcincta]|uniref:Uncharacterized protein n=1 Tax=Teladorsagia circumcincta TaxID=45464 RepID=A0A2G9UFP3_TELCI|nr:hypothetical protein TELCIR_09130 [Teladorsagia circumcincta]
MGPGRRLYSDDDPVTRDRRAGFDYDEEPSYPPNRRSNDFNRNERDGGRENWGSGERRQNDGRRSPPNDNRSRGFGGGGRGASNATDGYGQEYRRRDGFGSSKGNYDRDEYEDEEPASGFGGYRRDGQKSGGFGDRGRAQPRPFDDRNDDFDNRGNDRGRGNGRGRSFGNRRGGFSHEDQDNDRSRFNNRFQENDDSFGGNRRSSPNNRRGFGDGNDSGNFSGRGWSLFFFHSR